MAKTLVSDEELSALVERSLDLIVDLRLAADSIRKNIGYGDDIKTPLAYAKSFAGLASAAADLNNAILIIAARDEDKAAIEATIRARMAKDTP